MVKYYDLVCSLGGNCTVGNALRFRNLRFFSLPFDWCYIVDENPIYKLAECFKNDSLLNIALKENLSPLTEDEEKQVSKHSDTFHYKDIYSGYYFVNHFYKSINDGGYEIFRKSFEQRIKRLTDYIKKSNNILFILGTSFDVNEDSICFLQSILTNKYPNKNIKFEVIKFNCQQDNFIVKNDNLTIRTYQRKVNIYDFTKTNFEWSFLDDIKISNLFIHKISFWKKLFIKLCPIKEFRKELKKIYKI